MAEGGKDRNKKRTRKLMLEGVPVDSMVNEARLERVNGGALREPANASDTASEAIRRFILLKAGMSLDPNEADGMPNLSDELFDGVN
jgi:hypothetical protein